MALTPYNPKGLGTVRLEKPRPATGGPLHAFVRGMLRQTWLIFGLFILLALAALYVVSELPGKFKSEATIMIQPGSNLADPNSANAQTSPDMVRSQMKILQSPIVVARVVDRLGLMNDPEFSPKGALANSGIAAKRSAVIANVIDTLEVENDGRSATISLSVEANTPIKAMRIAEEISKEFIVAAADLKVVSVAATKARLDSQLEALRLEMMVSEEAAEQFRRSAGLIWVSPASENGDGGGGVTYQSRLLDQFSRQAADISANAALARAKQASGSENSPEILSSSALNTLVQRDAELAEQEAAMATRYNAQYPPLVRIRTQRAKLRATLNATRGSIRGSIDVEAARADAANKAASARAVAMERVVNQQIADGVRYRQLQRDALSKRKAYERVAEQSSIVSQRLMLQLPNAIVVSPASLPIKENRPNRIMFFLIACAAAFALACFVGLLRELTSSNNR